MAMIRQFFEQKFVLLLFRTLLFICFAFLTQTNLATTAPLAKSEEGKSPTVVVTCHKNMLTKETEDSNITHGSEKVHKSSILKTATKVSITKAQLHYKVNTTMATEESTATNSILQFSKNYSKYVDPSSSARQPLILLNKRTPTSSKSSSSHNQFNQFEVDDDSSNTSENFSSEPPLQLKNIDNFKRQNTSQSVKSTNASTEVRGEVHQQLGAKNIMLIELGSRNINFQKSDNNLPPSDNHSGVSAETSNHATKNLKPGEDIKQDHKNTWSTQNPTLTPIQNGFLGPIHMKEKTFSIIHKANKAQQHASTMQSQFRDRKFVEIIIPKQLYEHASSTEANIEKATDPASINKFDEIKSTPLLSTTVFQVSDLHTSTTHFPNSRQFQTASISYQNSDLRTPHSYENSRQTESKISDIQIEVYDSTVDSIISSTNFKESASEATTPPMLSSIPEKFTQYVIDHTDSSTQESSLASISIASGKPEPAAIEIHINVSEGLGHEGEDLEFSYRQSELSDQSTTQGQIQNISTINLESSNLHTKLNNSVANSDEILVVEVIDTGDNSTDISASFENLNVNPIFTFRSDTVKYADFMDTHHNSEANHSKHHAQDDLFMPDVRKNSNEYQHQTAPPPLKSGKSFTDRDSDTIFYISNTEVKVGETLPSPRTYSEQQLRKLRLENQFFPANYVSSTLPNAEKKELQHHYEENIILSPVQNTADSVKVLRSRSGSSPPLDVTYVGESVIEVEQSSGVGLMMASAPTLVSQKSDIIIQPAVLPEISIGVPIIGELPPQIELKEIDFMPGDENEIESHGNEIERIVESSIQYGGDLIDEGGDIGAGGFDGIDGSYPFGNTENSHLKAVAYFPDTGLNHHANNLKKNDLIADVPGSAEISLGSLMENTTLKENMIRNESELLTNGSLAEASHTENETAFTVLEDTDQIAEMNFSDAQTLFLACFATLLPLIMAVFLVFGLRYLYRKHQNNSLERNNSTDQLANGKTEGDNDPEEPTAWPSQTKHLPTLTSTDVIIETKITSRNNSRVKLILPSHTNSVSNESTLGTNAALTDFNLKAPSNHSNSILSSYMGPNGSVTTMTLKNNHLTVETEERNDISRDARETKMHYSTAEKDGIFVVEVARGVDSRSMPESPISRTNQSLLVLDSQYNFSSVLPGKQDTSVEKNHEEVQIHQPPQEKHMLVGTEELQMVLHQIEEVDEPIPSPYMVTAQGNVDDFNVGRSSNIGLSQSDLSSTSSADSNKRYSYGNQELYTLDKPIYLPLLPTVQSPLQVAIQEADDDHPSENGQDMKHVPAKLLSITGDASQKRTNGNQTNGETDDLNIDYANDYMQNAFITPIFKEELSRGTREIQESLDNIVNGKIVTESENITNGNIELGHNSYNCMIGLPDPPSLEEIKQLNDCSFIEANQLDSLPPPPPPPPTFMDENGSGAQQETAILFISPYINQSQQKHENDIKLSLTQQSPTKLSSTNKIASAPLTPPASPPLFSNGGSGIATSIALAVNVSGS